VVAWDPSSFLSLCLDEPSQKVGLWDPCGICVTGQITLRGNLEIVYVVFLKVQIALGGKIEEFNIFYL